MYSFSSISYKLGNYYNVTMLARVFMFIHDISDLKCSRSTYLLNIDILYLCRYLLLGNKTIQNQFIKIIIYLQTNNK